MVAAIPPRNAGDQRRLLLRMNLIIRIWFTIHLSHRLRLAGTGHGERNWVDSAMKNEISRSLLELKQESVTLWPSFIGAND